LFPSIEHVEESEIQPQAIVTDDGEPTKPEEKKPAENPEAARVKEVERELRAERKRRSEAEEATKFWFDRASKTPAGEPETEPEEPKLSVDLVDAISSGDAKAIKQAMREMGFVDSTEVERRVAAARSEVTFEAKLAGKYADLGDEESELFGETGKIFNTWTKGAKLDRETSQRLLEAAADTAAARLGIDPAGRKPARPSRRREAEEIEIEDGYETPSREERIRSQSGARGARRAEIADPHSEDLDQMQKSIVSRFMAAGANITEDGYRSRAGKGVRMSGMPPAGRAR
jgi:hypothetical protein